MEKQYASRYMKSRDNRVYLLVRWFFLNHAWYSHGKEYSWEVTYGVPRWFTRADCRVWIKKPRDESQGFNKVLTKI